MVLNTYVFPEITKAKKYKFELELELELESKKPFTRHAIICIKFQGVDKVI